MFFLKQHQINKIGIDNFIESAYSFLKKRKDGFDLVTEEEGMRFVKSCTLKAMGHYGFKSAKMIMGYILMVWELGLDYQTTYPIIIPYLTKTFSNESERAKALFNETYNLIEKD
jgi:hypothetical protein